MILLFFTSLVAAFIALVLASQLAAPTWLWALDIVAFSTATATLSAFALLTSKLGRKGWRALILPACAAAVALGTQSWLQSWLDPEDPVPRIDYIRLQLAAVSIVAALFALLAGTVVLSRAESWPRIACSGAVICASLFAAGPILARIGVPFDHRAFLGLAGLGVAAYAVVEASRRLATR